MGALKKVDWKRMLAGVQKKWLERVDGTTVTEQFPPPGRCASCGGSGWIYEDPRVTLASPAMVRCKDCKPPIGVRLVRAGVPPAEVHWRLPHLKPYLRVSAHGMVNDLRATPPSCILFGGYSGRGKTCASVAVLAELVTQKYSVAYVYIPEWLKLLRTAYQHQEMGSDAPTEEDVQEPLLGKEVLLLEDLGAEEKVTPWVRSQVRYIIHKRFVDQLPTIITTNLPLEIPLGVTRPRGVETISEIYGAAVGSRLQEWTRIVLPDDAPDLRKDR